MNTHEFGKQMCDALGLNAHKVKRITLEISANEEPTLTWEEFVPDGSMDNIVAVVRRAKFGKPVDVGQVTEPRRASATKPSDKV